MLICLFIVVLSATAVGDIAIILVTLVWFV